MSETARRYVPLLWFLLVAVAWLGPTLFGRAIFALGADLAIYYYPVFDFYTTALHSGQSFLWMPGIFSGFPIYLSQSGGFLDPINILVFRIFDGMTGMHIRFAIDVLVTLVTSFLAARALGLSRTAALLVGPSYLLAIHLRHFSNPIVTHTLFLLPLLLYTSYRALQGTMTPYRAGILAGVGLGWALLAGYTQVIVYALIFTGMFAMGHMVWRRNEWKRHMSRLVVYGMITLALGVAIGLPFIVPAQKFLPLSARAVAAPIEQATLKAIAPGDLLLTLVPDYMYFPYITSGRMPMYVGALWFLLAVGSVFLALRAVRGQVLPSEQRKGILVAAAAYLFALVAAFKWSPIFWAMSYVPILGLFRFPFRFMFLGAFFLSLLGGYGFDLLRDVIRDRLWHLVIYITTGGTAAFVLFITALKFGGDSLIGFLADVGHAILGATVYGRLGFTKDPEKYRLALENGLKAYREFFSFADVGVLVGMASLTLACVLLVALVRGWLPFERGKRLAIGLTAFTCICIPASQWSRYVPIEAVGMRPQLLSSYVGDDIDNYRMYSFLPVDSLWQKIPSQYLFDRKEETAAQDVWIMGSTLNFHLYSGISSLDGYDQFEASDYLNAVYSIGGEHAAGYGAGTREERIERLLSRLDVFGMMAGRYIVAGVPLDSSELHLLDEAAVSDYEIPLYIYEYRKALPMYYLATTTIAHPHTSFTDLTKEPVTFNAGTFLDCSDCAKRTRKPGLVTLTERSNGRYVFETRTEEDRYLILSESFLPGWFVTMDGSAVEPVRTNGLYMGVRIPPGSHTTVFEYQGLFGELSILKALGLVKD